MWCLLCSCLQNIMIHLYPTVHVKPYLNVWFVRSYKTERQFCFRSIAESLFQVHECLSVRKCDKYVGELCQELSISGHLYLLALS